MQKTSVKIPEYLYTKCPVDEMRGCTLGHSGIAPMFFFSDANDARLLKSLQSNEVIARVHSNGFYNNGHSVVFTSIAEGVWKNRSFILMKDVSIHF